MSDTSPLITVVIASVCSDARSELLRRACESVRRMAGDLAYVIVVVANGPRVSPDVLEWLAARPDVRLIRLHSASHPLARRVGAEVADSEFIAFLDDDDEFLPDTLAPKIMQFREHSELDVLVTDGWRVVESDVSRIFPPLEERGDDFVETMMRVGWSACSLTLRTRTVDLAVLDPLLRHMEWTLTALELARRYRVGYLDEPTFRYYETTPDSLSKAPAHSLAAPEVWRRLSCSYAGTHLEHAVRRRYGAVCHDVAWLCTCNGNLREAWRLHIESVRAPGGLAYVPFSAKLLLRSLRIT